MKEILLIGSSREDDQNTGTSTPKHGQLRAVPLWNVNWTHRKGNNINLEGATWDAWFRALEVTQVDKFQVGQKVVLRCCGHTQ